MDIKDVKSYLGRDWQDVRDAIVASLDSDIELLNNVNSSILDNSGKQLRPILALLVARACSPAGITTKTVNYAAAAELLHNATLLHDDVADGSEMRRGVPTVMSLMGPSVSVLVGDYWLVKAVGRILETSDGNEEVIRLFSKTLSDLSEGEMLQLQKAQKGDTDENDYLRIIYGKTASLFEVTAVSAAISVNASVEYVAAVRDYAVALGLAFQIKDDILDYSGTESVGKPLGVDILEQKITMPLLCALKNVSSQEQDRVRGLVNDIPSHPEYRDEIVSFVKQNGGIEEAQKCLAGYISKAVDALTVLPESVERTYLEKLASFTAMRDK